MNHIITLVASVYVFVIYVVHACLACILHSFIVVAVATAIVGDYTCSYHGMPLFPKIGPALRSRPWRFEDVTDPRHDLLF